MLDLLDATTLTTEAWELLTPRPELPCSLQEYMSTAGTVAQKPDSTRRYVRVALRSIAIVIIDEQPYAAYTKDVSKNGLGFYSPVQLFPKTLARVWLPGHSTLRVRLTRCRRVGANCYECGCVFDAAPGAQG